MSNQSCVQLQQLHMGQNTRIMIADMKNFTPNPRLYPHTLTLDSNPRL